MTSKDGLGAELTVRLEFQHGSEHIITAIEGKLQELWLGLLALTSVFSLIYQSRLPSLQPRVSESDHH